MIRDELLKFILYDDAYKQMFCELLGTIAINENTVAAITRCGIKTGTAFLSSNFSRVFGYPGNQFIEGDLQFIIKRMYPDDLPGFIHFAETSTLNARTWREAREMAVHEHCSRFKHGNGTWRWMNQKVIVLSVTPGRHIDHVLLLFDDCTVAKEAERNRHTSLVEKSRKNSKLLSLLAPISCVHTNREEQMLSEEDFASLTTREKEIMLMVSKGYSSKEIATKLFISKHTVESHRKHILRKLSVKNAPQMVHQSVLLSVK